MKNTILLLIITLFSVSLSHSQWSPIGSDIDGEIAGDWSGSSVSMNTMGNIIAIGAPDNDGNGDGSGHVRIYRNENATWVQVGSDIDGEAPGDHSGFSVSLNADGSIVAIGARNNQGNGVNSGHVRVYENENGIWNQIGSDINGEVAGDWSGRSVSLNAQGNILAIGSADNNGNGSSSGHVRVYRNENGTWEQVGSDIDGDAGSASGLEVKLNAVGSIVAISAERDNGNGFDSGHVRVYRNESDNWTQIGSDIDGEAAGDNSGRSISLSSDGNILAIGGSNNDGNGTSSGHVRVYENENDIWTQFGSDIDGEAALDRSGSSVSLNANGTILAIGAPTNTNNGPNSGHVRVYKNENGTWEQVGSDIDGEATDDVSGVSVFLSADGSRIAIGAPSNDGNGINSGHVRVYENTTLSLETVNFLNFVFYPNPVTSDLTIQSETLFETIEIYSIQGKKVKSIALRENSLEYKINVKGLSSGLYLIELKSDKVKQIKKFIKY